MVALSQTWKLATQQPPSAQITRQTPLQRKTSLATPIRMVLRARYFDPHSAEFISPDPLEYVDGMSQYRGYFVPRTTDPTGTVCVNCFCRGKNGNLVTSADEWRIADCTNGVSDCCSRACEGRWTGEFRRCGAIDDDENGDPPIVDMIDVTCGVIFVYDCATAGPNEGLIVIAAIRQCFKKGGKEVTETIVKKTVTKNRCKTKCQKRKPGSDRCSFADCDRGKACGQGGGRSCQWASWPGEDGGGKICGCFPGGGVFKIDDLVEGLTN